MAAPARALLTDLPKGYRFPNTGFILTAADLAQYLGAVDDRNDIYMEQGLASPLAVAARGLGALLDHVELPAGTLHTGQEVQVHRGVPVGAKLSLAGRVAQRSERAGLIISIIEFELTLEASTDVALAGRTTVMAPADGSAMGAT